MGKFHKIFAAKSAEHQLKSKYRWPPEWPPRRSSLLASAAPPSPHPENREEWSAHDWQCYAQFLEERGASVVNELVAAKLELESAKERLSRRKSTVSKNLQAQTSILGSVLASRQKNKPGRKPSNRLVIASEVLAIKQELESAACNRVTDKKAVEVWLNRNGRRRSRVNEMKNILNAMGDLRRKNPNI
jgi:hypothetical protein